MRRRQWIEWTRTGLEPREGERLLAATTPEQATHLREHDWVCVEGVGVVWWAPDGALRRARFTHGAYFETRQGEFYIDSKGHARALPHRDTTRPAEAA
jgi:hypothetical protein